MPVKNGNCRNEEMNGYLEYMDCFGDFNLKDGICTRHCALSILCVIERNQQEQMELMDELESMNRVDVVFQ